MALISVSVDICGSTKAKSDISLFSKDDPKNIDNLIRSLMEQFYIIEARLFMLLVQDGIQVDNLFVIKSIGDETWFVMDIDRAESPIDFNIAAKAILNSCIEICRRSISLTCFERVLTPEEEVDPRKAAKKKRMFINLPIKVFVDIVEDAIESSKIRFETYSRISREFFVKWEKDGTHTPFDDALFTKVMERLAGVSLSNSDGTKRQYKLRSDYIGANIDLFFRCAKHARDSLILCGETFANKIRLDGASGTIPNQYAPQTTIAIPITTKASRSYHDRYRFIWSPVDPAKMKGINKPYELFTVLPKDNALLPPRDELKKNAHASFDYLRRLGIYADE